MSESNHALSRIFKDMAIIYNYLGSNERFRAQAYSKSSRLVDGLKDDISVYVKNNSLKKFPGIGESIALKIREYLHTGKIKKYEELKKQVPYDLMELMSISGFGPKSLKRIHDTLKINKKEDLVKALEDGRILKLQGFGEKKVEQMKRGLKLFKQFDKRILLWEALELSNQIVEKLKILKEIHRIEVAGSIRRRKEMIGDIDILVSCDPKDRVKIVNEFLKLHKIKTVLVKGATKASIIVKDLNRQVDLRLVNDEEWGSALLYLTGSKEHNIFLRTLAKKRGLKINEYGVYRINDSKRIAGTTEEQIYRLFGCSFIPPELRECKGEWDLAKRNALPKLIALKDIRGDMQMHSDWSDGIMAIEDLAKFVLDNYHYDYIVLTDHSKSVRIAGGMNENKFEEQIEAIRNINRQLGKDFIKKGVEVDIRMDGSLDLDDKLLSQMDWVCASIHSGFHTDNTNRLIRACNNPYVNCIGHPSGRLIGKREEYKVNWKKVFETALATRTVLEINAQPERMDLSDELAMQAREAGVMLSISTDSHAPGNFDYMRLGVFIASRAWCTKADIINSKSWNKIEQIVNAKRKTILSKKVLGKPALINI